MNLFSKLLLLPVWLGLLAGVTTTPARAFSLLGPFEPWMTATNGFSGIGGPMPIGNGYRWNVPVVTYGFDQSFLDYFGTNGVTAVENAINLLNNLPPASQLNPDNYTIAGPEINNTAQSQSLMDLQSQTLFLLLEHLGLASPYYNCFALRNFTIPSPTPGTTSNTFPVVNGKVLIRNYDPDTDEPSRYLNDTLLSYILEYYVQAGVTNAFASPYPIDPQATDFEAVADGPEYFGEYYTGLTRDDVGGLLYLYSTNNVAYEGLPPDVQGANGAAFVNLAFHPGVDKVTFERQTVDPLTSRFFPVSVEFTNTYITNATIMSQLLQRVIVQPDFLFSVTDLVAAGPFDRTGTTNWINYGASNRLGCVAGPGVIVPPVNITFGKIGPQWINTGNPPDNAVEVSSAWASFDGSTNPPIIYPQTFDATNGTPIRLDLNLNPVPANFRWLAQGTNRTFAIQTSTNFSTWTTLFVATNNGNLSSYFNETPTATQRFYRLVPQ